MSRTVIRTLILPCMFLLSLLVAACAAPSTGLPVGPTPIPTLAPATEIAASLEATATQSVARLSYPAQPPSAARGQTVYNENCAQCHGTDGKGIVPAARNFRDLDYVRGESPAAFYAAVNEGRGDMPSFNDRLTSDDIWDTVFYIWRMGTTSQTLAAGRRIFNEDCASCHGEDGSGALLGSADFTDLRQMDGLAPRDLYLTITQGRGSMPAWQSSLSQDQRWEVIDYLRTFTYLPELEEEVAAAAPPAPTEAPAGCDTGAANPIALDDAASIDTGKSIYESQCMACHGQDASGGLPDTPDFTSSAVSSDLHTHPGKFFCVLSEGEGAMPPFANKLDENARWQVLTFLGSLAP